MVGILRSDCCNDEMGSLVMVAATVFVFYFFFFIIFIGVELILCKFQVYSKVNQLYIYTSTLF